MKFWQQIKDGKWIPYTIASCSAVLVYLFFSHIEGFFSTIGTFLSLLEPIFIGIVIAYLVSPLVRWIELHPLRRIPHERLRYNLSLIIALVTVVALIGLLMSLLIPQLISSVVQFIANINYYSDKLSALFHSISAQAAAMNLDITGITDLSDNFFNNIATFLSRNASKIIGGSFSIGGKSVNIGIGIILALYFLGDKKAMLGGINRLLRASMKKARYAALVDFLHKCNIIMTKYIAGDILDAVIVGLVNFIFMYLTGMPYAVLISVVVGITNLAPTFGPFVGAFIGAFVLIFAEPMFTLIFLIFTLILQTVDGYIIKPKLFGDSLGVPGVWIVIGVIVGGKLFGVMGILLAIPVVAILDFQYHDILEKRERRQGIK